MATTVLLSVRLTKGRGGGVDRIISLLMQNQQRTQQHQNFNTEKGWNWQFRVPGNHG